MNKLAIAAAALLVITLLGLPPLVGSVTEARVRERVEAIDASPAATATVTSFERGWFRSTARIELSFVADNPAQLPAGQDLGPFTRLPVEVEFGHGPVAMLDGVHFGWSKLVARPDAQVADIAELQQTLGVPYLFEFRGRSSYLGAMTFDGDAPSFELPVNEALLKFSGGTLGGTFSGGRLDADASVESVEVSSPTGIFALRGLAATADNELRSEYVMTGQSSLTIASITAADAATVGEPLFEASDVVFRSDVNLDSTGELLDMRADYTAASIRVDDSEVTAAALGIGLQNVDAAAVEAYGALARDASAAGADPAELLDSLGPHLERALQASPSLTLDPVRFRYDDEPFEGRVAVTTNTARLPPAGTLDLGNPFQILGLVDADADVRLSKPLAGELATLAARLQLAADQTISPEQLDYMAEAQSGLMLTMLVGQGVLLEDGAGYRSTVQYRDGTITLNGNTLPFGL